MNWKNMPLIEGTPPMGVQPGMVVECPVYIPREHDSRAVRYIVGDVLPGSDMYHKPEVWATQRGWSPDQVERTYVITAWAWLPGCEKDYQPKED